MSDIEILENLRAQRDAIYVKTEIEAITRELQAQQLANSVVMEGLAWGDQVDRNEWRNDTPGWSPANSLAVLRDDRKDGKFRPFWEIEQDLLNIWGLARWLSGAEEVGLAPLESLTNYTMGNGFTYSAAPPNNQGKDTTGIVKACQAVIDEFMERVRWEGEAEHELFQRAVVDGEFAAWVKPCGSGRASLRIVDPECITEPSDPRQLEDYYGLPSYNWSFGVATDHGDTSQPHGYFLLHYADFGDWDYAPAAEFIHAKYNVPRSVKRGLSDYFPVVGSLRRVAKLLDNMLEGMAIQASIPFIRQHPPGTTSTQAQSMVTTNATSLLTRQTATGSRTGYKRKYEPGTILDISAGLQYLPPPIAQTGVADAVVGVVQAGLRRIGSRWQLPEYMISSDASNANYSSTLVAGSPFVKATERRQAAIVRPFTRIFRRVLEIACQAGRFAKWGIYQPDELRMAVSLDITPPSVSADEDKLKRAQTDQILVDMGAKSIRTVAEESGLDYEAELKNGAKRTEAAPPVSGPPSQSSQPPASPPSAPQSGVGGAPLADTLNGAQVTAAIDTIKSSGKEISDEAAVILLRRVGLSDQEARRVVAAQKQASIQAAAEEEKRLEAEKAANPFPPGQSPPKPVKESWQRDWWTRAG